MKHFIACLIFISNFSFAETTLTELKNLLSKEMNVEARNYSTQDFGREKYTHAVSFIAPEKEAKSLLAKVKGVIPLDAKAFIGTTRNLSDEKMIGVEIVVLATNDKFDILRASKSDGINYDITNADLIEKLKSWDAKYGIDIWQAETDTVQLTLSKLPVDLVTFSQEIYEFCPDVVDQGSGDINDTVNYLKNERAIYLWWD
jgi:hypothetical protein